MVENGPYFSTFFEPIEAVHTYVRGPVVRTYVRESDATRKCEIFDQIGFGHTVGIVCKSTTDKWHVIQ